LILLLTVGLLGPGASVSAEALSQYSYNILYVEPQATTTNSISGANQETTNTNQILNVVATTTRTETDYADYGRQSATAIAKIFATITYPNGGEIITLSKSKTISYVKFNYGGPLQKTSGNYSYRLELWRYGKLLGNIIGGLDHLQINPYNDSINYGAEPGRYYAKDSKGYLESKIAEVGGGYTFKAVILEAITPKGEATYYKELASDFSDKPFSYAADTSPTTITKYEPIFAKILTPNGGENISLAEEITHTRFEYGGSLDKGSGNYKYRLELWRDGLLLGNISNFEHFPINPYNNSVNYGGKPGTYWAKNDKGILEKRTAEAGSGYRFKAILSEAYTPKGEATKYRELANDFSDAAFTFVSGALVKLNARVSAADVVKDVTVRGWDPKKKEEIAGRPEDVKTEEDLQAFMKAVVATNPVIFDTTADESSVGISFKERAKLFGFIPISIKHNVKVNIETGEPTFEHSWWATVSRSSFGKNDELKQIQEELKVKLSSMSELGEMDSLRLQMMMDRRSKFIQTLSNILKKISDTQDTLVQNLK